MIDYRYNAQERVKVALTDADQGNALVIAQIATAEATLALVDAVDRLANSFGICDHGYTIRPEILDGRSAPRSRQKRVSGFDGLREPLRQRNPDPFDGPR